MRTVNRPSLAATLSLSTVIASVFAFAPLANAQTAPAVSQDPASAVPSTAVQYFANGATFPGVVLRNLHDFYGIPIPATVTNIGQVGSQGGQFANSPFNSSVQVSYCSTGSGNGRATYTGTALVASTCGYVTAPASGVLPAPFRVTGPGPLAPASQNPLPGALGSNNGTYSIPAYPAFAVGPSAVATDAPLFAFSDAAASTSALSATDLANYAANKRPTRSIPIQVPVFFGAVVPAVNRNITANLTTVDLCNIFAGVPTTIGGVAVTPVVRSDSSGTTTAFTSYLAAVCGPGYYITAGVAVFPTTAPNPSTSFARRPGNDGVADFLATTGNTSVGYVESAFTPPISANAPITINTPAPVQLPLQNPISGSFLRANVNTIRAALSAITITPIDANPDNVCVLRVNNLPIAPVAGVLGSSGTAYPIVTQTYALTYGHYPTQAQVDTVRGLFSFILGDRTNPLQANDQLTQAAGFVLPGTGTTPATNNPLRRIGRNCINRAALN